MIDTLLRESPAQVVIRLFGGVRATARIVGRDPGTVSNWKAPKEKKGCGGRIPASLHQLILEEARLRGLDLTERDLIWGRTWKCANG